MTAATTTSRILKIQFEFCQKGCGDGTEKNKKEKCTYFHIFIHIQYMRVKE